MVYVFLRDNDVGWDDQAFFRFHSMVKEANLPMTYAVIPAHTTQATADFLLDEQEEYPVESVLHGWTHQNYQKDILSKYEFGGHRGFDEQYQDLQISRQRMDALFGKRYVRNVFVPPWHQFNADTLKALHALDFDTLALSTAEKTTVDAMENKPLLSLIHVFLWLADPGFQQLVPVWLKEIERTITTQPYVGLLFHHSDLVGSHHDPRGEVESRRCKYVLKLLKAVAAKHRAQFVTQSELLKVAPEVVQ